ncbi:MAG: DNA alkylation repair protein [Polyangiaceae bacterium]|nr:DNA alkylation repair protein [Polyangiaceae bacterium]
MALRPAALKDQLDREAIQLIAQNLAAVWEGFDAAGFVADAMSGLSGLELKARVEHVIAALARYLPTEYPEALGILVRLGRRARDVAPEELPRGFAAWPLIDFVARYGLDHFEASLEALRLLTPLFTAEFAVRPFLERDRDRTLARLRDWVRDPDPRVRRLVSEGTRPRLPWGKRLRELQRDPRPVLELLEELRDDASEMVRRSVANNLADIAKDHPELVLDVAKRWLAVDDTTERAARDSIVRRATRSLANASHDGVWSLLGVTMHPAVRVSGFAVEPTRIRIGEGIRFSCELRSRSTEPQQLALDYAIHFVGAGGRSLPKVYRLRQITLAPSEGVLIEKRHTFRILTTRRYYAGEHRVELRVNGRRRASGSFLLQVRGR